MAKIGFIGLGSMGSAMAARLLEGNELAVWNRTASAADTLVEAGASRASSVEEIISTGFWFSMLSNDAASEQTFTAATLAAAPEGSIHVNHSTLSLAATDRLAALHAAAGIQYVSAPVLGRPNVAAAGKLNVIAAGAAEAIERAQPFLALTGKQTWNVGTEPHKASLVKIGFNYNLIHAMQALGESLTLMEAGGVDSEMFVNILTDVTFTGAAYTGYGKVIATKAYAPAGFALPLGLKDLGLTEEAASTYGVTLPSAPVLRDMFERALDDPALASLDWSAIAEITRGLTTPSTQK
jgi:3-hydroxyisobutyrate dehydrogenase-like beta-hydroxyacid dehydrogenase